MKFSNMIIILNMIYLHFGEVERLMLFLKMTSNFYLIKIFKNVKYILIFNKIEHFKCKIQILSPFQICKYISVPNWIFIYLFILKYQNYMDKNHMTYMRASFNCILI